MLVTRLGKRYAKSLLDLATELNKLDEVVRDMETIKATTEASRELRTFLKSPIVEHKKKVGIINAVFEGQLNELTQRFIALMAKHGREGDMPVIAEGFLDLYQEQQGIEKAVVTTAHPLSEAQLKALSEKLHNTLGKQIVMEQKVDEHMIGGLKLRVANKEYNGGIDTKLRELKKKFKDNPYVADF